MAEWHISKPLGKCFGSDAEIQQGQEYYGALIETDDGFERRDYSVEYWQQNQPSVYCYWKSVLPDSQQKRKIFIDDDMLLAFFERLADENDQEKIDFRFVLMLVLMRKRKLKYQGTKRQDDREIWELKNMRDKEIVSVINPHLDEERIEQLREQMGQIMQGELEF